MTEIRTRPTEKGLVIEMDGKSLQAAFFLVESVVNDFRKRLEEKMPAVDELGPEEQHAHHYLMCLTDDLDELLDEANKHLEAESAACEWFYK